MDLTTSLSYKIIQIPLLILCHGFIFTLSWGIQFPINNIVEKSGIPMVVILNANEYERIIQERDERFKILDRIKAKLPDISSEEVEKDVKDSSQ